MEIKKMQDNKKIALLSLLYNKAEKIEACTRGILTYNRDKVGFIGTHGEEFMKCVTENGEVHYYNSELKEVDNFKPLDILWLWDYPNPDRAKKVQVQYNSYYELIRTVLA